MKIRNLIVPLVLVLAPTACDEGGGGGGSDDDDEATMDGGDGDGADEEVEDLSRWEGYYEGDYGPMLLVQVGNEIWGAYDYDEGTFVGTVDGAVLTGWWAEAPSYEACDDAGQLRFILDGDRLDGSWSYGLADGSWAEDWDLERSNAEPLSRLENRIDDDEDIFFATPDDAPTCGGGGGGGGSGSSSECSSSSDCGSCSMCSDGACFYCGEGPYGCYC